MKISPTVSLLTVLLGVSACLTSCVTPSAIETGPDGGEIEPLTSSVVPAGFLASDRVRLNEYLDTPKSVEWKYMRLPGLFDYSPVDEIRYEFEDLPQTEALFELSNERISPRELLYEVSKFYELEMSVEPGNFVLVKGRES